MKRLSFILAIAALLFANNGAFAAWELLKNEPSGTNYIDNTSYKCTCRNPDIVYFTIKQIPTHSDAKYVLYRLKANIDNGMLYTYATRYYYSGYAKDIQIPAMPGNQVGRDSALAIGIRKACGYCDKYCKTH